MQEGEKMKQQHSGKKINTKFRKTTINRWNRADQVKEQRDGS